MDLFGHSTIVRIGNDKFKLKEKKLNKTKKPLKRDIQRILNESCFNPREPGALKILVEIDNPDYFEIRALELIQEAQICTESAIQDYHNRYHEKMQQAISLLALARLKRS